jgi:hypothetical protein
MKRCRVVKIGTGGEKWLNAQIKIKIRKVVPAHMNPAKEKGCVVNAWHITEN